MRSAIVAAMVGFGVVMASAMMFGVIGAAIERDALGSTQQCNTACQERMTDCVQACDGVLSCEVACKKAAEGCVSVCTSDAGQAAVLGARGAAGVMVDDAAVSDGGRRTTRADSAAIEGGRASSLRRDR